MKEEQLPNFNSIEENIFTEYGGKIFIGREEIKPEVLDILRDQARYIKTSQFYEILKSTIINEAMSNSLISSKEWNHVLSAKMLWHWQFVLDNMINSLSNIDKK